ncbi:hypothetical protein NN561_012629 [Cricetulus griseus]
MHHPDLMTRERRLRDRMTDPALGVAHPRSGHGELSLAPGEAQSSHGTRPDLPAGSPSPGPGVPTVDLQASQNVSSVKRSMRLVLPTPREPMMMTCSLNLLPGGQVAKRLACDLCPELKSFWVPGVPGLVHAGFGVNAAPAGPWLCVRFSCAGPQGIRYLNWVAVSLGPLSCSPPSSANASLGERAG